MTNHVRTLLLNLRPATPPVAAGEEYVPEDFNPARLPQALADVRTALFGPGPSRAALNLLLARLLAYLHTSPLGPDVTATDARITYDPANPAPDADPQATTHNPLTLLAGAPDFDTVFRPDRAAGEQRWFETWSDPAVAGPLRVGALALALAARTEDVLAGRDPTR